jgi:dihydrofolate synthase / folylpolyglutamate synthase
MQFIPVKTRVLLPPKDNIFPILDRSLPKLRNGDIICITSKVLGIHQGRCIKIDTAISKLKLIKQEADSYIRGPKFMSKHFWLTIKDNTLIPTSGIDESNGNGYYILWPKNTGKLLKQIADHLKKKYRVQNLGIIATDSHTVPLRLGLVGIATGCYGFNPLKTYIGQPNIFGRPLQFTSQNIADSLAATAVLAMGEGSERTPVVIVRGVKHVQFNNKNTFKTITIDPNQDIYRPLLRKLLKNKS